MHPYVILLLLSCQLTSHHYIHIGGIVKKDLTRLAECGTTNIDFPWGVPDMTGEERRSKILQMLMVQNVPLSGTALAAAFHVSRQVIVQDIALMRAENHDILSTNRGYLFRRGDSADALPKRVFSVRHTTEQVLEEFMIILDLGGKILDVVVEHALYGQIRVDLLIESARDAREFYEKLLKSKDNPLKVLTDDCHYHTVAAPSEKLLDLIEQELGKKGFLY